MITNRRNISVGSRCLILLALLLLPAGCIREDDVTNTPEGNFETLWKIIDEHYCFLEYLSLIHI